MDKPEGRNSGLRGVVVEGLVIVTSILLAFGIDAWWDSRQEARVFSRTLDGLEAAFSANVVGIEEQLVNLRALNERLEVFLESSPTELAVIPTDSAHAVLTAVHRQGTASLNNEYLTQLVDAADLSGYPAIDSAVAIWRREAFLVAERREVLVDLSQQLVAEASRYPELSVHVRENDEPHEDAPGLARLREDPEVLALAIQKAQSWGLYERYFRRMLEASESLVEILHDTQRH